MEAGARRDAKGRNTEYHIGVGELEGVLFSWVGPL